MKLRRIPDDLKQILAEEGISKATQRPCSGHIKLDLYHDGRVKRFTFGGSPSDPRAIANMRADVRRFVKGIDPGRPIE